MLTGYHPSVANFSIGSVVIVVPSLAARTVKQGCATMKPLNLKADRGVLHVNPNKAPVRCA